jgi:hypothetical protein
LDPWVGIAIGVFVAAAAITVLLVARTQPSSDQHDSAVSDFDEEER